MKYEVAFTTGAETEAIDHLLQHCRAGRRQEDLCFALWKPSTGTGRITAIIGRIIPPCEDERQLHGTASFTPQYAAHAIRLAYKEGIGLAFMHSHPHKGWQPISMKDAQAERDVLSPPARATGMPLVGLTIGVDGYWSARFWHENNPVPDWCTKTRIVGPKSYQIHYNDRQAPPSPRSDILRRTYDTWGTQSRTTSHAYTWE